MRRIQIIIQLLILLALWLILVEVIKPDNLVAKIILWVASAILGGLAVYLTQEEFYDWMWGFTQYIKRLAGRKDASVSLRKTEISVPISPEELRRLENIAPPRGAELIVISSGKGGVGKSLLALGIVEHLSKRGNVLLVDFDLQNRGLTSLLNKSESDPPSVFGLLDQFRSMLGKGTGPDTPRKVFSDLLNAGLELPSDFNHKDFLTMTEKFARARDNEIWDNLQEFEMLPINLSNYFKNPKEISIADDLVPLYPPNAFFLPSRLMNQSPEGVSEPFLFTGVSTLSFPIVYLFLRSLSWWLGAPAHGNKGVESIVLDCHGAHDMFTVGSILAAQKLIIVTTPDPGSWDGTAELLKTVQKIQKEFTTRKEIIVVFNSMQSWDEVPLDMEEKFAIKGLLQQTVPIAEDKKIRNLMKQYEFGQIAKHRRLWKRIRNICETDSKKPKIQAKPKRKDDLDTSLPVTGPKEPDKPKGQSIDHRSVTSQTPDEENKQVSNAKEKH